MPANPGAARRVDAPSLPPPLRCFGCGRGALFSEDVAECDESLFRQMQEAPDANQRGDALRAIAWGDRRGRARRPRGADGWSVATDRSALNMPAVTQPGFRSGENGGRRLWFETVV